MKKLNPRTSEAALHRRSLIAIVMSSLWLAACARSNHALLVSACVEEGQSRADCTCLADLAKEQLSDETYSTLTTLSQAKDKLDRDFLGEMSISQAAELARFALEAGQSCKISGMEGLLP